MFGIGKSPDHIVLERLQEGDEQVLVYLQTQHYRMIRTFVLKNNGDDDAVNDVMQDTMIAVWKNASKTDFLLRSKLSTYIMAIAKNLWFKELKKRSRFKVVDETNSLFGGSEEMPMNMDQSIIRHLIEDMDSTCKKLLSHFYFDGLSTQIIAEKMGFANANSVKSKKYQCFKKIQAEVLSKYNKEDLI